MRGTILTIGYQGCTPEALLTTVREAEARAVVDVRAVAWSRRPEFTKRTLAEAVRAAGLIYVHLPGLGHPAKADPTGGRTLAQHLASPTGQAALAEAAVLLRDHGIIALMCMERDPAACHRTTVADALSALTGAQVHPLFIPADPRQGDLFGGA